MRYVLGLVVLFGLATTGAAQGPRGLYIGGGLGATSYEDAVQGSGLAVSVDRNALRIIGGYRFNDRYGVEAAWGTTGDVARTFSVFALRGIAIVPLSRVGIYGGAGYYEARFNASGSLVDPGVSDPAGVRVHSPLDDSGVTVVGGLLLDLRRISLRGEYEWLDTDGTLEASSINALVVLRF